MGFLRRKSIRKEFDEILIQQLFKQKEEWNRQKKLVANSVEPSLDILFELKLAQAKYFFYLREAKKRNLRLNNWR
ncbi:YaaL family protein [Bacillus aerius]|uniref:YaaL family protein n=1 Tax=Bacillus aerius TaxID=293388 RepID=UPI0028156CA3|nr:YaaL family protein [Bacillus aerius]WMT29083.1 YaaL family protein [Bacillus aerius]